MSPRAGLFALVVVGAASVAVLAAADDPRALRPTIEARYPAVRWIGTAALARALEAPDLRPALLDTRAPAEYAVSHLRGARWVDPDREDLSDLDLPRDAPVVVYCSVGWRSAIVADRLRRAGFTAADNLEGGIFQWANEGRPVFRGDRAVRQVHPFDATWGRMLRAELRAPLP